MLLSVTDESGAWSESQGTELILDVRRAVDHILSRSKCLRFAQSLGYSNRSCWEIALAASELVSNVLKHAGAGRLTIRTIKVPQAGLEVRTEDCGPGITDPERALQDGYSEGRFLTPDVASGDRRGLGCGLGAVKRLMDAVSIGSRPQGGAIVVARKWRKDDRLDGRLRMNLEAIRQVAERRRSRAP